MCRADASTENVSVAAMQKFVRLHVRDEFGGGKNFLYRLSVTNQRIEGFVFHRVRTYRVMNIKVLRLPGTD